MDETGTPAGEIQAAPERLRLVQSYAPSADFLSQLIAERDHLPPQRARRRASPGAAVDAYQTGAKAAVRRLPPGYRRTVVA